MAAKIAISAAVSEEIRNDIRALTEERRERIPETSESQIIREALRVGLKLIRDMGVK